MRKSSGLAPLPKPVACGNGKVTDEVRNMNPPTPLLSVSGRPFNLKKDIHICKGEIPFFWQLSVPVPFSSHLSILHFAGDMLTWYKLLKDCTYVSLFVGQVPNEIKKQAEEKLFPLDRLGRCIFLHADCFFQK